MGKEGFTYDDLLSTFAQKKFFPVYLFHGEEDFLAEEATSRLIDAALTNEERGFNLDVMYGSEADARDIVSHASSFPMMAERRVVVIRDLDRLSSKELLSGYIERPSATTCLVLLSAKPDFRKKPYATAKKNAIAVEFRPLREYQLPTWIAQRFKKLGKTIDPEAGKMLVTYVSTSLREVENEIEKLSVYIGQKSFITVDDIAAVVGVSKEFNVFELQKAIGAKDMRRSTEILLRMLEAGESPTMIIIMLARYFTSLWRLCDIRRRQAPAADAGINPYFLKEYVDVLSRYSQADIEGIFEVLAGSDEQLKSSSPDPKLLLQSIIVRVIQREAISLV